MLFLGLLIGIWQPGASVGFWQTIEGRLIDTRFLLRGPLPSPEGVAILAYDDAAISTSDAFPPTRSALGVAVSAAAKAKARAIVLDFLLVGPRENDPALAEALSRIDAVLGLAEAPRGTEPPDLGGMGFAIVIAEQPADTLPALAPDRALAAVASMGHVAVQQEADGTIRRLRPALPVETANGIIWYPGLSIAAVTAGRQAPILNAPASGIGGQLTIGQLNVPLDRQGSVPLLFYGPEGTIPTYSIDAAGSSDLSGKIVFVGATATGFGDRHATVFDASLPGVELHATLAANLLEARLLRRDAVAWSIDIVMGIALAGLGFFAAALNRVWIAGLATVAVTTGAAALLQLAFVTGWWLDGTTAGLALLIGSATGAGLRGVEYRKRAINLARYQPPSLVETIAAEAEPLFARASHPAVVLFVDVAGFTTYSEHLSPERTETFLRLFHGIVERAAEPHGGMIAHFAGDGVIVVFHLKDLDGQNAIAALRFVDAIFEAVQTRPDWPGLGIRIGGHAGQVRIGLVGGARHRHVSISGDVVNTASRLQEFAKSRKAALALSDDLVQSGPETRAWSEKMGLRNEGPQVIRGRSGRIILWIGALPSL